LRSIEKSAWVTALGKLARAGLTLMLACLLFPTKAICAEVPIEDFARFDIVTFSKLSPDGKYLAKSAQVDGTSGLIIERLADHKVTAKVSAGVERGIYDVWWASSDRIVATLFEEVGPIATPAATGEMIAFNADYSGLVYLFGFRGNVDKYGFKTANVSDGFAVMIDPLPDDPQHVLIAARAQPHHPEAIIRLNVADGSRESLGELPEHGSAWIVTDQTGAARYVSITRSDGSVASYLRANDADPWKAFATTGPHDPTVVALSFSRDGKSLYEALQQATTDGGRYCLATENIENHDRKVLSCDSDAAMHHVTFTFDSSEPMAIAYDMDMPSKKPLAPENRDLLTLERLRKSFPDSTLDAVSTTRDGSKIVVLVRSDRNPGDYYLFDTQTNKAEYILSKRDWIRPGDMSPREPIVFKARDGTELHGYLTRPVGVAGPLPLVMNPHGGPFGIADTWYWDADAELLATRGYAVLQINFRGSGGRGKAFEDAGKRGWATTMIDDLTDGAHWAIEHKITEQGRLCIYGASYGGFAALMSAEREPDLYRCAVGYSCVYDLNLLASDADFIRTSGGRAYFDEYIGDGEESLAQASPVNYVSRLKASLLIVHGLQDPRAPYSQAEALMTALDARRYPYEKLLRLKESHGFYTVEHRVEFYQRLLKFLDRNLAQKH